jgi:branched-chain amino acid transport system ATP-binding protein
MTIAPSPPRLLLDDVTKSFGGIQAVRRLSLQAARGEILGLIGPNGAGKSTVLTLIAGEQQPTAGRIFVDGRRIDRLPQFRRVRAGVAHLRQHTANLDGAKVADNVLVGLGAHGARRSVGGWLPFALGGAAARPAEVSRCLEILDQVGLRARMDAPVGSLSHWEKRLVSLARVLAADPVLVLLDEPFAGLSAAETAELMAIIRRLRDQHQRTFVLAEHNVDAVLRLCDRIVAMHFGEKIAHDLPDVVARHQRVVAVYLGESPP